MIPGGQAVAESGLWWGRQGGPLPFADWRQAPGDYQPPVLFAHYKWLKAIDLREKLDNKEITTEQYNAVIGNNAGNPAPNIKMVIMEGNNHVLTIPGMSQSIRAMKKTDFNLVFTQYADMASALYADILIPQSYIAFEGRNGGCGSYWQLFTNMISLGTHFIYRQKCVEMPGEVRSNDWVWTQIAKRLGLAEQFNPRMAGVYWEDWEEAIERIHQEAYEKWAELPKIKSLKPPGWEEFQRKPVFRFPMEGDPYYSYKYLVLKDENPFKGNASGKIEFYSQTLAKGADYLKTHDVPSGSGKCYGGGNLPPMAQMVKGGRDTFFSSDAKRFPLLMSSPHSYYRVHSWLDNNLLLNDCYRHAVWMNVADAKRRGIKDGALVKVYNDRGEMVLPAYVTSRIVPGEVAVHHGSWYAPGQEKTRKMPDGIDMRGAANLLTHDVDLPETLVGCYPCKGLVEIEMWGEK
jgi:anaerobic dimethyl sulfoxide reductase subunit A